MRDENVWICSKEVLSLKGKKILKELGGIWYSF